LIFQQTTSIKRQEAFFEKLFLFCAWISIASVVLMIGFIFARGLPLFKVISPWKFLTSINWHPTNESNPAYGIGAFIVGTLYVTIISLIISVPVGLACGIFLAELSERTLGKFLTAAVELLAGIPSVIYGLFGMAFIVPIIRHIGGTGFSILAAAIILSIMTLPTIINMTEVSLRTIPDSLREGSYALGATKWQTIIGVLLPAARSGIVAGIVLGMGRAMGETMAVLMVGGNSIQMAKVPTDMVRTLTMNIITDMAYATGDHMTALFTTGCVLFIFILILNLAINIAMQSAVKKQEGRE